MTYTHISGIYSFFTGEANLNTNYPDFVNVYTTAHEMAHQRGISREDEANFTAFLVCIESESTYVRYSAYLNMFEYLSSALYSADYSLWLDAYSRLSFKVSGELSAYSRFSYFSSSGKGVTTTVFCPPCASKATLFSERVTPLTTIGSGPSQATNIRSADNAIAKDNLVILKLITICINLLKH